VTEIRGVLADQFAADTGPPGFHRRPQYRMMLVCGLVGILLGTTGLVVGCAVDTTPTVQLPGVPGLPGPGGPAPSLPPGFPSLPPLPPGFPTPPDFPQPPGAPNEVGR
jgi:hypothetical protein